MGKYWINIFNLVIVLIILLPNIIYAVKHKGADIKGPNKAVTVFEQLGRYASIFLMLVNIFGAGFGFFSGGAFIAYLIGNAVLVAAYLIIWLFYFKKVTYSNSMALAIIPVCIFMLCAVTLNYYPLMISSAIFGIFHIYIIHSCAKKA